jgi:phytoene synthase
MTPEHYCVAKAAPAGSANYYAFKKLPPEKRIVVTAVCAFYIEIEEAVFACSDPALAFAKLDWWKHEVANLKAGECHHPVMRVLKQHQTDCLAPRLMEIIDGLSQNIVCLPFLSFEEITIHIMRTAGVRELLIAELLEINSVSTETIYQFAMMLDLVHYLQHLHQYVKKNIILFADDELNKFSVTVDLLQALKTTDAIKQLLSYQAAKAELAYQQGLQTLSIEQQKKMNFLIIRCNISLTILDEVRAAHFDVLEHFIRLTPLRCWWIALKNSF